MKKRSLAIALLMLSNAQPAVSEDLTGFGSDITEVIKSRILENADEICSKISSLPKDVCIALAKGEGNIGELLNQPKTLNSALNSVWGNNPLNIKFKAFQVEGGEQSLGFSYSKEFELRKVSLDSSRSYNRRLELDLNIRGNVAFEQKANPNDFMDAKFSFSHVWSTNIDGVPEDVGLSTQNALQILAKCPVDFTSTSDCAEADALADNAFSSHLSGFKYFTTGTEVGFESDQAFDVTQTTFGAFAYGQIEDWTNTGILGKLGLFPSIRVGVDLVDPDDDTPRSILGDKTNFFRFSGEVSMRMPLMEVENTPLFVTANYRYYRELGASSLVSDAGLDDYGLLTLSLAGTNGIFVSYSTGELPLDADRSNVVEIGWQKSF